MTLWLHLGLSSWVSISDLTCELSWSHVCLLLGVSCDFTADAFLPFVFCSFLATKVWFGLPVSAYLCGCLCIFACLSVCSWQLVSGPAVPSSAGSSKSSTSDNTDSSKCHSSSLLLVHFFLFFYRVWVIELLELLATHLPASFNVKIPL